MNEQFQQALDFANYRQTLASKKRLLKEKAEANLTFGYNGGLFKINQTLLNFVHTLLSMDRTHNVVLLDNNDNPILIEDVEAFKDEIFDRYFTTSFQYYEEYKEFSKKRSVEKLLND